MDSGKTYLEKVSILLPIRSSLLSKGEYRSNLRSTRTQIPIENLATDRRDWINKRLHPENRAASFEE